MKIVFIGSGNVATHLSLALQAKGVTIGQVYSRTSSNAQSLASKLGCPYTTEILDLQPDADIYIYATKDNSILKIINQINLPNAIHVHTAGSMNMDSFKNIANKYGVLYPLQTFSIQRQVDFSEIPICVEGSNTKVEKILLDLANLLSKKVYLVNSEQRKKLHLAAIFACNFTNYMYDIAYQVVDGNTQSFEMLQPLILETAQKVLTMTPLEAQTGPAIRHDENIIRKHLTMLEKNRDIRSIYKDLSKSIHDRHIKK